MGPEDAQVSEVVLDGETFSEVALSPGYRLKLAGIDDGAVAEVAGLLGVRGQDAVRATLEAIIDQASEPIRALVTWQGEAFASSPEQVEAIKEIIGLSKSLSEILCRVGWPAGSDFGTVPEADDLGEALAAYGLWLTQFRFVEIPRNPWRTPKQGAEVITTQLTYLCQEMNGINPICQGTSKTYPFYEACLKVCQLLGIEEAEKSSVRDWIRTAKAARLSPATKSRLT